MSVEDLDSDPDLRVRGSDILIRKNYKGSRKGGNVLYTRYRLRYII
jgi:hypothetical protein